jgi:hypothetical protein
MDEFSECLFEMRGQKWALTSFGFEVWGETEEDTTTLKGGKPIIA